MTQMDIQIGKLKQTLAAMGDQARSMLDLGVRVLETRDAQVAKEALAADLELNRFETQLDHMCERRLALHEPFATDFRYIFSAIKTTRDLERIGDEVKIVARWGPRLPGPASETLMRMAIQARAAVASVVEALVALDDQMAERIIADDASIDRLELEIVHDTDSVAEAFIAHALERVGDRAKNIAENIIYAVRGTDVRHLEKD